MGGRERKGEGEPELDFFLSIMEGSLVGALNWALTTTPPVDRA